MKTLKQLLGAALGIAVLAAPVAQADVLVYSFSNSGAYSGTVPGAPADPSTVYATATITWSVGLKTADIVMAVNNNLLAGAYVNDWYFNLDPNNTFTSYQFISGTQAKSGGVYYTSPNSYKADGGGLFDLRFQFNQAFPGQLGIGHTSEYTVTTSDFLSATSFNYFSVNKNGDVNDKNIQGAVHVQGYASSVWLSACVSGTDCQPPGNPCDDNPSLPECGGGSNETPEPASLALIGTGLMGLALARRRRSR